MKFYQHTQGATNIVIALSVSALALAVGATAYHPLLLLAAIMIFTAWLFHSLTIEIIDGELRWRFGPGWIRRRVVLNEIASARVVRTRVIEGWGIHYSRFGWLYNVAGFDAVAIILRNGKRFCLGSDEPEVLAAQLSKRRVA
jgi:hypothetical protein